MAKGTKKYYWLKLQKDFFKRHDVKIIENMPNGKDYIIFYLKLLTESISHGGMLRFNDTLPYDDNMLATITDTNIDVVRSAIKLFKSLHLMEVWDDLTLFMTETQKMLGYETEWAKKKREYKARQNLEITSKELPSKYPYKLSNITVHSEEQISFENGVFRYVDEKRYGGNGKLVLARSNGKCEQCGLEASKDDTLTIHHDNEYSNNIDDLLVLCKTCHGFKHTGKKSPLRPPNVRQEKEKELELEIDTYKDNTIGQKLTDIDTLFNKFWKAYPRKVGKDKCLSWFKRRKVTNEFVEDLIIAIKQQEKSKQWQNKQYIPHPYTWLNRGGWNDELDYVETPQETIKNRWENFMKDEN